MKLDYALQRKIDDAIIATVNAIGHKCRGRIEIEDGDGQVIEFEGSEVGKWKRTRWGHKDADDVFSIFPEFSTDLPLLKKLKENIAEASR